MMSFLMLLLAVLLSSWLETTGDVRVSFNGESVRFSEGGSIGLFTVCTDADSCETFADAFGSVENGILGTQITLIISIILCIASVVAVGVVASHNIHAITLDDAQKRLTAVVSLGILGSFVLLSLITMSIYAGDPEVREALHKHHVHFGAAFQLAFGASIAGMIAATVHVVTWSLSG
jgi:hypothetical protein